jgi:3-oxoacyl-[acyl-carrier protein] reductase
MKIEGARAVVTGGARGMGLAFAKRLRQDGARVFVVDVDAAGVDAAKKELDVSGTVADVSDESQVAQLFQEATDALGGAPNVLLNNAGILRDGLLVKKDRATGEVKTMTKAQWDAVIGVNLTGPFLCMREFARRCVESDVRPAVAVNMSSVARSGNMGQSNYSAAKAGLAADTMVWGKELAKFGIRVGAVAPGFIRTPMVESMRPEVLEKVIAPVPLARLGEPDEIYEAIRFIVVCDYFTGRVVEVDGGLVL